MTVKRFKVTGEREDGGWGEDVAWTASVYVNASSADEAVRKARVLRMIEVVEVPADEGRGPLWRLLRWLGVV